MVGGFGQNLLLFKRPQSNLYSVGVSGFAVPTLDTWAQRPFFADNSQTNLTLIADDFESEGGVTGNGSVGGIFPGRVDFLRVAGANSNNQLLSASSITAGGLQINGVPYAPGGSNSVSVGQAQIYASGSQSYNKFNGMTSFGADPLCVPTASSACSGQVSLGFSYVDGTGQLVNVEDAVQQKHLMGSGYVSFYDILNQPAGWLVYRHLDLYNQVVVPGGGQFSSNGWLTQPNVNITGQIQTNGVAGVTSTTCTQWTKGICTHN